MYINLTAGCVGIDGVPFAQLAPLAAKAGFAGIDAPVGEMEKANDYRPFLDDLKKAGLRWGSFGLPVDFRRDQPTCDKGLAYLKKVAPLLASAGVTRCSTWIMPADNELPFKANFDQHRDRLGEAAKILAQHHIRLGLEFVGPKTLAAQFKHPFIRTLDGMLELCAAVESTAKVSNMGILLDSFHWYTSGATSQDVLTKLSNRTIVVVHVNDAIAGRTPDQQIDNQRAMPCATGVIDSATFVGCLRKLGYDGPVSAEPFMPELAKQPHPQTAAMTFAAIKKMLDLA
ncbi:MAG: sugar phosphate isomerase/epimerase [Phycisphaeraceae bacterium]|nr:sugar phosphate isomerase/epimerase [Phycisphaeraceae bacterium]